MRNSMFALAIGVASLLPVSQVEAGPSLDAVKARGQLVCGVGGPALGFASALADGKYVGIAVDICRAISVAVLGDATKVKFVPLAADKRFPALKAGEVDVLVSGTSQTMSRDIGQGVELPAIYLYDGQGFLVPRKLGKRAVKDLNGLSICVAANTTSERNLANYFRLNKMTYKPVALEKVEDLRAAFFAGRCEVYSGDALALYGTRAAYAPIPQEYMVLPEMISKEPLSLVVRENDALFGSIVRWTFNAMLQAEESGITSKNVDEMTNSENPDIKRLLGVTPGLGKLLGVDEKWIYNIVKQVGNYGESFERNLGAGSQLKIPRGQNMLWNQGGLHYSPPFH